MRIPESPNSLPTRYPVRHVQALRNPYSSDAGRVDSASSLVRILVLDEDTEIVSQLENALWVWPHKVTLTGTVENAERLCKHLAPSAILVALDHDKADETELIPALRKRIPAIPIIAIVSGKQYLAPGRFIDQGANALLTRDDVHLPTLHDLLVSVQPRPNTRIPVTRSQQPELLLPWCQSDMLGALICDINGLIIDANQSLATWLGYADAKAFRGKNVLQDLLVNRNDWNFWTEVAGDTRAMLSQDTEIATTNGQILWTKIEVFVVPSHPNYIQAVFVNLTEWAILAKGSR